MHSQHSRTNDPMVKLRRQTLQMFLCKQCMSETEAFKRFQMFAPPRGWRRKISPVSNPFLLCTVSDSLMPILTSIPFLLCFLTVCVWTSLLNNGTH
eukprot:1346371-Amorphochlora_amoeboformis.AAC.1